MPLLVSSLGLKDYISREMRILQCNNKTTNRGKQAGNKATGVNMDAFSEHLSAQTKVIIAKHKHMEAESIKHNTAQQNKESICKMVIITIITILQFINQKGRWRGK